MKGGYVKVMRGTRTRIEVHRGPDNSKISQKSHLEVKVKE